MVKIAKLNKVDLRELWKHEALDFTKWLSEPDNLELLSDEIGIGIELVQIEANVGRYHVDILAQEENTARRSSSKTNWRRPIIIIWVSSSPMLLGSKPSTSSGWYEKLVMNICKPLIG